ncbi:MAG: exopolysaccharide biosynthesis protein [Verrucomicrobiota bacterium]
MMESPPTDSPAPFLSQSSRQLSREIDGLLAVLSERPVTLREIIAVIRDRAYTLLLILLSLPFCLPLPLPGLSTALGAVIALIGFRLALRLEPWLPARILDAKFSARNIARILTASKRIARGLEALLKPRWCILTDWVPLHHLYGTMVCISGLLLLLPLPIPLSNGLPALTIIFLAGALLERDGYFVIVSMAMFVITLVFFGALFFGGVAILHWLEFWFDAGLDQYRPAPL